MLRIGSLQLDGPLVMAPMAGTTNLPFRIIARKCGASLVMTEMVSAKGLVLRQKKTLDFLASDPDERPLGVQIFGSDPAVMAEAAAMAEESGADLIDINMGCPVRKVLKTGAGGSLMRDPHLVEKIVSRIRRSCALPLTAKVRTGFSPQEDSFADVLRALEAGGADAVTVHARYVLQGFSGLADWTRIAQAKSTVIMPVIGNGDVTGSIMAADMMNSTGCDGVMIGRAAASNPWVFSALDPFNTSSCDISAAERRRAVIYEHCILLKKYMDSRRVGFFMRGVLLRYTKGLTASTAFRNSISSLKTPEELMEAADRYLSSLKGAN